MTFKKSFLLSLNIALVFLCYNANGQDIVKIDFTKYHQKIDGFGASSAWHGTLSESEANVTFGNGDGQLGLSILRVRIDPAGQGKWGEELMNAKKAIARGAIVFATPWSPPAAMKSNNHTTSGELKASEYGNYVNYLNSYVDYMAQSSVQLSAISIQNEPNIKVDYESCDWSIDQMFEFCKTYAHDIKVPVMVPETYNFNQAYSNAILNDSTAASHVHIIGGHLYGTTPRKDELAEAKNKPVWMTEHYYDPDDMATCLMMAKEMSDCMNFGMSAYVWWWLRQPSCNLINAGGTVIKKKGYIMAQYSKFIRPGYFRTDVAPTSVGALSITAYKGEKQVIVAVNRSLSTKQIVFELEGDSLLYFQRYITTATKNLHKASTLDILDHKFMVNLEPQSVTTLVNTNEDYHPVSIGELKNNDEILVYPNPIKNGWVNLNSEVLSSNSPMTLSVFNLEGKTVYKGVINSAKLNIGTGLKTGVYVIEISGNNTLYSQKVVIE